MRRRRRYLLFALHSDVYVREDELRQAVTNAVSLLMGESRPRVFRLISFDSENRLGILRCDLRYVDAVRSALLCLSAIVGSPAAIWILKMSGTIKSLRKTATPSFI
ncbi:MAG: Rpp14/Pop5 family protein [Candidatus Bathyarchaeia archaeon]